MAILRKLRLLLDRRDLAQVALLLGAIVVMALLEVAGIASVLPFLKLVADPELVDQNDWLHWIYVAGEFESPRSLLLVAGLVVLALFTTSRIFSAFTHWYIHRCGWSMAHSVGMRLLRSYMTLPYEFYLGHNSAELMKKVASDVHSLISGVLMAGMEILAHGAVTIVLLALLVAVEPVMALSALALFGATYAIIHQRRHAYARRLGQARLDADARRYRTFSEALTGMKAVQSDGAEPFFVERFRKASQRVTNIHPRFQLISILPRYIIEIVAFGGVLLFVLYLLAAGRDVATTVPTLGVFAMAAYRLLPALNKVFTAAALISHNLPVVDEIYGDVRSATQNREIAGLQIPNKLPFRDRIRLESVRFQYESAATAVLRDIDVHITKGAKVAFVGATGSGKTTLVDVLLGLLVPQSGSLLVDDTPIDAGNVVRWRRNIGYVPQDVFLFDASLAENIAFGQRASEIDMERLQWAGCVAQIEDFIVSELPEGYHTEVGERGVRLSGGQRQRIGLARALYRKPDVLILDEATSALDGITEEAVIGGLQHALQGVTIIMIAHRLSTVRQCDRIYLLDGGQIVETGTFDDLMASSKLFEEMVQLTTRVESSPEN